MKKLSPAWLLFLSAAVYRIIHYFIFANRLAAGSDVMQNILLARKFAAGNYYGVLDTYWPPVYPILVGSVNLFVDDLILPAMIVSIIVGSLASPLIYFLTKQSYGEREGVIAGVIAIFYPFLINSVFAIGTENVYLVLVTAALIVGWKSLCTNDSVGYFVTGLLLGLSYLTRPEAFGYLPAFGLVVLGKSYLSAKTHRTRTFFRIAALIIGFFIVAAPYLIYLKVETGTWTVSGKVEANIMAGALKDEGDSDLGNLAQHGQTTENIFKNLFYGTRYAQIFLASILPLFLVILSSLGLFRSIWKRERLWRELYLLLFCILTIGGYIFSVVLERYLYVLLPVFIAWIARGIVEAEQWYLNSVKEWRMPRLLTFLSPRGFVPVCLVLIFFYMFTANFYVRSAESAWQGAAFEERDAGKWIRKNASPNSLMFSPSFRPIFYGEGEQFWTDTTDPKILMSEIKEKQVRYVILNDRSYKKFPYLREFNEVLRKSEDFKLVYEREDMPGYKISIFELK